MSTTSERQTDLRGEFVAAHAPRLAPLVRSWPQPALLVAADGTIQALNDGAAKLLRLADARAEGLPLSALLGEAESASLLAAQPHAECHLGVDSAPAGQPVLRARATRVAGVGEAGDVLIALEDVSEAHRLRSHLEQAERLASIGELLSSVAHELSNPLTTVLGYADLLLGETDDRLPRDELERIRGEALRCRRIVGNLLDLARAESIEMRPVHLPQVAEKVVEFRNYAAQVGQIHLVREIDPDVAPVNGDFHRLVQAVLNLVTNAEDAVRARPAPRRVVIRTLARRGCAVIEVEDNGPGVPDAIRGFVFEPFFTTKPRGHGTGLGLSLVRATARSHGGTVEVTTGAEGGALFSLALPVG